MRVGFWKALLAKYDLGLNTIAGNLGWSGATRASASNPAGDWETGGAYVRRLGSARLRSRLFAYSSLFFENATLGDSTATHSIGCTYYHSRSKGFDLAWRRVKTFGSGWDNQGVATVTIILGKRQ